jgi:hypothetical protein
MYSGAAMTAPRVYACFDAAGCKNPAQTDLKYYFLLRAWGRKAPLAQAFIDVHDAEPGFNPRSSDVRRELEKRMERSDVLLLILSERTAASSGWISWEIEFASRHRRMPIVCAYTDRRLCHEPSRSSAWWPEALRNVATTPASPIEHVAFQPRALAEAFQRHTGS